MCPKILSRLGHITYDIVGGQIIQTAVHHSQANTVGTTEVSLASLAELLMLGVAIIANDVSHFGSLAALSMAAVIGATSLYYHWMARVSNDGVAFDSSSTVCRSKVEDLLEL
jgi:iron-regulated transporter 1